MTGNDDIDQLIDKALASYCIEPRAGIEGRVMTRVRAQRRGRVAMWLWPALAACLATIMFMLDRKPEMPAVHAPRVVAVAPKPLTNVQPATGVAVVRHAKPRRRVLPKQDVFPTPWPLTEEERVLLRVAQLPPEELKQVIAAAQPKEITPIEIQPIRIEPLQPDGE